MARLFATRWLAGTLGVILSDFLKLRITIGGDGSSLERIHRDHFSLGLFDYNTVVPMPVELNIETGSNVETGYAALYGDWQTVARQWMLKEPAAALNYEWPLESREQVLKSLEWLGCAEFYLKPGRAFRANLDKYGHGDALSWQEANWGADCNGDLCPLIATFHEGELHIEVTVGSYPKIVMRKLSENYPSLTFHVRYVTEYDRPGRSFILRNGREVEKHKLTIEQLLSSVRDMPKAQTKVQG